MSMDLQIVTGILLKQVNLSWRPRLFVLYHGVLSYYKVYGPDAVNVASLLDSLRTKGEVSTIGAEISILESRDQKQKRKSSGIGNNYIQTETKSSKYVSGGKVPVIGIQSTGFKPHSEVHMQVATVRESKADSRKLHIHSGTSSMRLRAETSEDRWAWLEALLAAKGTWTGFKPIVEALQFDNNTWDSSAKQQSENLKKKGKETNAILNAESVSSDLERILEDAKTSIRGLEMPAMTRALLDKILEKMHTSLMDWSFAEESKRKALTELIYELDDQKRQLETALVVESGTSGLQRLETFSKDIQADGISNGPVHRTVTETSTFSGSDEITQDVDDVEEDESSVSEEFFECEFSSIHQRIGSGGSVVDLLSTEVDLIESSKKSDSFPRDLVPILPQEHGDTKSQFGIPSWIQDEGSAPKRRSALPEPIQAEKSVSLWSLIKEMVGKDLTRVCLPVYFNEPLSALQKTAEDLEYSELLDEAYKFPRHSVDRLLKVAAFAVSPYSSTVGRTSKPFNPLLGETYELVHVEKGFRFISEKVSHHPTIIAAHAEGRGWQFEGDAEVKSRFWGRSIELRPEGMMRLTFDDGDIYCWNKVCTTINNLVLGKIYIDHGGIMRIRCLSPEAGGLTARLRFKETGMLFDKDPRQVRGFIEQNGVKYERPLIYGHWDDSLFAEMNDNSIVELWKKSPAAQNPTRYNLTTFAMQLNEITPGLEDKIAPTDSRLRPDQLYTEKGMWDEANAEKQRVEHKQRAARRAAELGEPLHPQWFNVSPMAVNYHGQTHSKQKNNRRDPGELYFSYKGGYWESRAVKDWSGSRDIFGHHVEE